MRSVTPTSHALIKAKNPAVKPSHLKDQYKDSYTAPELVDGTGKLSTKWYLRSCFSGQNCINFHIFETLPLKNTLVKSPEKRPTIQELKAALIAGV